MGKIWQTLFGATRCPSTRRFVDSPPHSGGAMALIRTRLLWAGQEACPLGRSSRGAIPWHGSVQLLASRRSVSALLVPLLSEWTTLWSNPVLSNSINTLCCTRQGGGYPNRPFRPFVVWKTGKKVTSPYFLHILDCTSVMCPVILAYEQS